MERWFIDVDGEVTGPFAADALTLRVASRQLAATTRLRREGDDGPWTDLREIPRFARLLPTSFTARPSPVALAPLPPLLGAASFAPPMPVMPIAVVPNSVRFEMPAPPAMPSAPIVVPFAPVAVAIPDPQQKPVQPLARGLQREPTFPAPARPQPHASHRFPDRVAPKTSDGGRWILLPLMGFAAVCLIVTLWLRSSPESATPRAPAAPSKAPRSATHN